MKRLAAVLSCVLALSCAAPRRGPPARAGTLHPAVESSPLVGDDGATVSLGDYRGRPFVLSTFFTSCTVRCPLTIGKLLEIDAAFAEKGECVPIVLVTLDPRTDTPERLHAFRLARHLPAHWLLLRGSVEDTVSLSRALRVRRIDDDTHIDHDVRIAFVAADGTIRHNYEGWTFDEREAVAGF
jgi:protein SCO1/2